MHHLPRFFGNGVAMDSKKSRRRKPRLERRKASKDIEYDASSFYSSIDDSSSSSSPILTRSLDLYDKTSFRIEGTDGELDRIYRSLGFSGPEDFSIPTAAWEDHKIRSSSDVLPRSRLNRLHSPKEETAQVRDGDEVTVAELSDRLSATGLTGNGSSELKIRQCCFSDKIAFNDTTKIELELNASCVSYPGGGGRNSGIKGARPPFLKPPPGSKLHVIDKDFSPEEDRGCVVPDNLHSFNYEEYKREEGGVNEENAKEENLMRIGETVMLSESCSFTTSNDDDSSSTTTEPMSNISPNGRFKRTITCWQKGDLLGRGSFGSVYEGISDDGFFFAVKEVSLLDQGSQGKQSIIQLEQEIALLSQFEHENIVQYYGTDKDQSNLYIFLEFVTKGSLLNLYQRYHLKDSQVSAYTRQILHGLKYLHDRNVVHRDVKCANILVDASGSVKLADFGLAKATKLNDVKSCKGTAFWMAPEVINQKGQGYGIPADIWSLGCTVLEMLTRQIPYHQLECMQALYRIGRGEPPPVPDSLSKDARDFIMQCIQVKPDARPTAAKLLEHQFVKRPLPPHSGSASPHILGRRF
ncbi:Mitogen-activated protein kinase kinase kinase 1 [Hibiscus syriacus]|uniref:mitogen-activated protein kinase kinase kinase n=1 Tax=Hibiscus syriacus TaxID=106335 RepID=A0A6A3BEM1_HIBSY|nr:mitogen-activated protein kinase kinase kinase 1-like [Hibiscus syriacus]XP_039071455.1 mitogen-activated protein kinase kinase kinase 1-like [Hibiscus syriacus]KAE8714351.1 Mitogen-activated protein kinase kinase kinase 1 [Hibiscus syriacus]